MRIVFISGGARQKALARLIEAGENIVAVITPQPSAGNQRFLEVVQVAQEAGIPVHQIKKKELQPLLSRLAPEILISAGWLYLLHTEEIETARYAINVHGTLLPKYRGTRVLPHILMHGEKESGVTVHFIDQGMDTGDIILQESFAISPFETTRSLYRKTLDFEPDVLLRAVTMLKDGSFVRQRQQHDQATVFTHMRTPADSIIDKHKPLRDLIDDIRACDAEEYPAYFYHHGEKVCIKLWRPGKEANEEDLL